MKKPSTEELDAIARRAARRCLWAVEQVLFQWEHGDAECEFFNHIREELEAIFKEKS